MALASKASGQVVVRNSTAAVWEELQIAGVRQLSVRLEPEI
jgi:hypothetical protein